MKIKNIKVNSIVSRQALMLMVAFGLILFASIAWFVSSQRNSGISGDINTVGIDGTSIRLFHITERNADGTIKSENQVDRILITNYVPNQSEDYRLEIVNNVDQQQTISLSFFNINADFVPTNLEIKPDIKLADKVIMSKLSAEPALGTPMLNANISENNEASLRSLFSGEDLTADGANKITVATGITLSGKAQGSLFFTFTLDKNADNEYQQLAVQIEKVQLAVK